MPFLRQISERNRSPSCPKGAVRRAGTEGLDKVHGEQRGGGVQDGLEAAQDGRRQGGQHQPAHADGQEVEGQRGKELGYGQLLLDA